jgi:hypothetical protein
VQAADEVVGGDPGDVRSHRERPTLRECLLEVRPDRLDLAIANPIAMEIAAGREQIATEVVTAQLEAAAVDDDPVPGRERCEVVEKRLQLLSRKVVDVRWSEGHHLVAWESAAHSAAQDAPGRAERWRSGGRPSNDVLVVQFHRQHCKSFLDLPEFDQQPRHLTIPRGLSAEQSDHLGDRPARGIDIGFDHIDERAGQREPGFAADPTGREPQSAPVAARWPDAVPTVEDRDRERIALEMLRKVRSDNWAGTRLSRVSAGARAAFDGQRRNRSDLVDLHEFYFEEAAASTRRGFLGAMAQVYLESFEPASVHSRRLANALRDRAVLLPARWQALFRALPELLDPEAGHSRLAARMAGEDDSFSWLRTRGLRSPHAPGFMDFAHAALVTSLAPRLQAADAEALARLFAWIAPAGREARQKGAELAISALLGPWRSADPEQNYRERLENHLAAAWGDPRVARSGVWDAVPQADRAVYLRWLVGATLEVFLQVVTESEESHMWAPRRKFWGDLHKKKLIDDATVALSRYGVRVAQQKARDSGNDAFNRFARQTAGGSRSDTCLLILRIGGKTFVEGSHNYKVHVFGGNDRNAPVLHRSHYDCEQIRLSLPDDYRHKRPHLGGWQRWVLEQING